MTTSLAGNVYRVTVLDPVGQLHLQKVSAPDAQQAIQIASSAGNAVVQCELSSEETRYAWIANFLNIFKKKSSVDTVVFSQDMATLMDAGVTIKEAIAVLHHRETNSKKLDVLNQINTAISQGVALSEALKRTQAFPELLVATIAASEQTGDLATGLSRYAKHQQSLRTVRDRVVGACVYPLLLLVVGSLVIALLLGVVVPRFATLIDSNGKELPLLSKILMGWGHFVDGHPWVPVMLLLAMVALMVIVFLQLNQPETRKKWLARIPGVARVVREFQHLQMYRTTAILTSRGITIHKALIFSLEFLDELDQLRLKNALSDMRQGVSVSAALARSGLSDAVASSMINVAERTGAMPEMLDRIADFYERTLQRNIDIVSRLIEPLLMIIFGIVIGGIVVLMYLPIFDLASSIS
jgi:general secretion pathway protein F